jgi:hypothetical protein
MKQTCAKPSNETGQIETEDGLKIIGKAKFRWETNQLLGFQTSWRTKMDASANSIGLLKRKICRKNMVRNCSNPKV